MLLKGVAVEHDLTARANMTDALRLCFIHCLHGGDEDQIEYTLESKPIISIPMKVADRTVSVLAKVIQESIQRRLQKQKELMDRDDVDEEAMAVFEELIEDEEELVTDAIDALGYVCKNIRGLYLPLFKKYLHATWMPQLQLGSKGANNLSPMATELWHNALC